MTAAHEAAAGRARAQGLVAGAAVAALAAEGVGKQNRFLPYLEVATGRGFGHDARRFHALHDRQSMCDAHAAIPHVQVHAVQAHRVHAQQRFAGLRYGAREFAHLQAFTAAGFEDGCFHRLAGVSGGYRLDAARPGAERCSVVRVGAQHDLCGARRRPGRACPALALCDVDAGARANAQVGVDAERDAPHHRRRRRPGDDVQWQLLGAHASGTRKGCGVLAGRLARPVRRVDAGLVGGPIALWPGAARVSGERRTHALLGLRSPTGRASPRSCWPRSSSRCRVC